MIADLRDTKLPFCTMSDPSLWFELKRPVNVPVAPPTSPSNEFSQENELSRENELHELMTKVLLTEDIDDNYNPHNMNGPNNIIPEYILQTCESCGNSTLGHSRDYIMKDGSILPGSITFSEDVDVGIKKYPQKQADKIESPVKILTGSTGKSVIVDPLGTKLTIEVNKENNSRNSLASVTLHVRVGVFVFKKELMSARLVNNYIDIRVANASGMAPKIRTGVTRNDIRNEMEEIITRITTGSRNWFDIVGGASENIFIDMTSDALSTATITTLIANGLSAADELHAHMIL